MAASTDARVTSQSDRNLKAAFRQVWAAGDYHRFATATVWELGPVLAGACGISAGQRVLDVASGTGNVAIRAAERGAAVVASDLTPENFDAGRRAARAAGVELEWIEGDAEALPFADGEFDCVTSSLGAIFAPNHQAVAGEMLRVCRPGGTIGMINFTPRGAAADFFGVLAPYTPPPPPGAASPLLWGSEEHVQELFGGQVDALDMRRGEYTERAESADAYLDLFKRTFGPMVAIFASLRDQPGRTAALEREFREFVARCDRGPGPGPIAIPYEYLLIVARKRA